jgi:membrane protein YdbS with pleckstrin-like domain
MRRSDTLTLFEEGIARNFTLLSRNYVFTGYATIRSVIVTQGVLDRLLGLGTITLITSDAEEGKIQFNGIKDPYAVGEIIQSHLAQA